MAKTPPTLGSRYTEGNKKVGPKGKKLENRLGKNWRKKVYGKKYKAGTLGKLGDTVFNDRQKVKAKKGYISKARSNLKSSSGTNRAAIEARLKTLISEKNSAADQIKGSKAQKQKFVNLREKALSTTAGKLGMNEVGNARKAAVKAKLNEKTTNGGTAAPNDSSAQNNKKPHKVNVGDQGTNESGNNKRTRKQPKRNEGRKNKAQYNGGTTAYLQQHAGSKNNEPLTGSLKPLKKLKPLKRSR